MTQNSTVETQGNWKNHEDDPMEQMRRTLLAKESDIDLLKKQIQEETKEKYSLYKRIVELNAEIEKLRTQLNEMKGKIIKIQDIENFQAFVSSQHDALEKMVIENTKFVTDVQQDMRTELNNGLTYFEKTFFAEEGKLTKIRKNVLEDVSKNSKIVNELNEKI